VDSRVLFYDFFIGNPTGTDTTENLCLGSKACTVLYYTLFPAVLSIRITDAAFQANPDPVPEKNTAEFFCFFQKFAKKGIHKGRPSYRKSF
jgi:hypothetical protein